MFKEGTEEYKNYINYDASEEERMYLFNCATLRTKEDVLADLKYKLLNLRKNHILDGQHSVEYRHAYIELLTRFTNIVEKSLFLENLDPWWSYSYTIEESRIFLSLEHADCVSFDEYGAIKSLDIDEDYTLISVNAKLLTVEEYAQIYNVEPVTVRQWIRRGKIKTAIKTGSEWRIPELSEPTDKFVNHSFYEINAPDIEYPIEYSFMNNAKNVSIHTSQDCKTMFKIRLHYSDGRTEMIKMTKKDKDRFEFFLISNPFIKFKSESSFTYA